VVGAGETLAAIAASDLVKQHAPALAAAAFDAATPQLRNRASLAGNLLQRPRCWYCRSADLVCSKKGGTTCPAVGGRNKFHAVFGNPNCPVVHPSNLAPVLWALEARVQVAGSNGATRSLTMPEFLLMPQQPDGKENGLNTGDVVLGVELPKPSATKGQAYREAREKQSFDWALVSAGRAQLTGAVAPPQLLEQGLVEAEALQLLGGFRIKLHRWSSKAHGKPGVNGMGCLTCRDWPATRAEVRGATVSAPRRDTGSSFACAARAGAAGRSCPGTRR
jgi:hypothetical protein